MTDKRTAYKLGQQNAEKCNEANGRIVKEPPLKKSLLKEYRKGFNDNYNTKNDKS